MKVLLCARQDYLKSSAGDSIIVKKIYKNLRQLGVNVDIDRGELYEYNDYDIIHLFNINVPGEIYRYYRQSLKGKSKIVITPLYFNMSNYYNHIGENEKLKLWNSCNIYRKELLRKSHMIFCNSKWELENLKRDFKFDTPCKVIYNGVNMLEYEDVPLYNFTERHDVSNYVLSVGRIYEAKNQLILSKVCNELNLPLVLVGGVSNKNYFKKCLAYKNVQYLGFMDNYNVYNAYKFAKVHALPSFMELTSLSSLEAAASGCNIVVTEEGASREYFEDLAIYCNPYNENSIKEAIIKGYNNRKNDELKEYVCKKYTWENTARQIYEEYLKLINS
ncbi:glycosyl transferases group 1 family protein [Clostridium argentinense CDC 2741]|uniref:Glycosyl transferases group 1 family protein n=1 Tax=Clostridium argentinense CDC 2741 TaxID=1418104 RepID=A0A0C1R2D8_9CLOT|nr:glycosyltransferase [Clostridium argentinense]ARC84478.1 group 1 glycosyl transferase [Clostridium argentinense]KIE47637.1 glycosyl transferases group 1 family protein [Clostridium argentinense CDC 2741]NFF38739.1 glycosyltransferase [Clostridium argentinense]NFP48964.1 glycosyltransferase [Clostridium argentinense]NFP72579.1 glycosyltransferase [Clostridium argentinense]